MAASRRDRPQLNQWHAYCEYCQEMRAHRGDYELVVQNDNGVWVHTLLLCTKCEGPILVVQEPFADGDLSQPTQLYPAQRAHDVHGAPRNVRESFREAVRCFERGAAHTATAIMCRRTLETICQTHGAAGRNLPRKLRDLHAKGVIDQTLLDWAMELKALGDEAADSDGQVTRQDANDALEFTAATLGYVYTYRQSFDFFKRRRDAEKQARKQAHNQKGETFKRRPVRKTSET
jgi:hypothetical protein